MNRLPSAPTVMLAAAPRTALTLNVERLNHNPISARNYSLPHRATGLRKAA